ncbi:MAG: pyridine nucleotide-disulfide oxidoreductase [Denitrovibrio sp.]|nr:MAG: pyridine nucleotide-disulfide oxidoreductase [Denitrovibrio sp.]
MKRLYPLYFNKLSPCYSRDHLGNHGCYARNDIPRFLYLTELGRFEEAFYVLKETNPFSSGCGRFCDHPCETACNRTKYDEPVDIKAMERFISDWGYKNGLKPKKLAPAKEMRIAVIGSGPAGLSAAYFLARQGYRTDVYEKEDTPGGLLTQGIPAFRYPPEVFNNELDFIKKTGVNIKCGENINKDKFLNLAREYDAVIVSTGAHKPIEMNIEGENLAGVESAIPFLRKINFGMADDLKIKDGERICVVGGGYSAIDVARSSVRLGAKPTVVYRRTEDEMTAHSGEVADTIKEGVDYKFLRQPLKIEKTKSGLKMHVQVMKLGPVDESGRAKPFAVPGLIEKLEFDRIVLAVGDRPDLYFVGESFTVDFQRMLCPDLQDEDAEKIFITGDAAYGNVESTGMVVRVVGLAQDTVKAVREFLGEDIETETKREIAFYNMLNTKYFEKNGRLVEDELPVEDRQGNFEEIVQTVEEDIAMLMSSRCFNCGICIQCDWCWFYSDGSLIKLKKEWVPEMDAHFYEFLDDKLGDATYKSVEACPRSALTVTKEGSKLDDFRKQQYISACEILPGECDHDH